MAKRRRWGSARGRRWALKRNQIAALILHGSLITTEARAKVLKSEVERLISRSGRADLATRRRILAFLQKNKAAKKLFGQIVPQFKNRKGGFVRVVKLPPRRGDNAPMARVEFVEKIAEKKEADNKTSKGKIKSGGKRIRRDSASKSA